MLNPPIDLRRHRGFRSGATSQAQLSGPSPLAQADCRSCLALALCLQPAAAPEGGFSFLARCACEETLTSNRFRRQSGQLYNAERPLCGWRMGAGMGSESDMSDMSDKSDMSDMSDM